MNSEQKICLKADDFSGPYLKIPSKTPHNFHHESISEDFSNKPSFEQSYGTHKLQNLIRISTDTNLSTGVASIQSPDVLKKSYERLDNSRLDRLSQKLEERFNLLENETFSSRKSEPLKDNSSFIRVSMPSFVGSVTEAILIDDNEIDSYEMTLENPVLR